MAQILLLGEGEAGARYLVGAWNEAGHRVTHRTAREETVALPTGQDVVVISDYPSAWLSHTAHSTLAEAVLGGTGLVMVGGWTSFTGAGGEWGTSPIGRLLPVVCATTDDRRNVAAGVWFETRDRDHRLVRGLAVDAPPVLCGYNEVTLAAGASVIAVARHVAWRAGQPGLGGEQPLLVAGRRGSGRVVAFTSDLTPHWCGGIVDWGSRRTRLASGAEVGDGYITFVNNLIAWATGG